MRKITKEKIYELKITDDMEDESGIDSISLVDTPAIEINWVAFSKEKEHEFHIPDGEDHIYLEKLLPYGQDEQELLDDGYEIDTIEYKKEGDFIYSNPNQPSDLDTNLFRIRYKYVKNPQAGGKDVIPTTRMFCAELIKKNLVFRLEDMLNQVNDQGSSFADWRGGYNCRHLFAKIVYKKKGTIDNNARGKNEDGYDILGSPQNDTRTSNPSFSKEDFEKVSIDYKLLDIVNLKKMECEALVPTSDISKIKIGQSVLLHIEGLAEEFIGNVTRINPATQAGSRSIAIYIQVANPQDILKVGMFVDAQLVLRTKANVIAIPQTAVHKESSGAYVYALENNLIARKNITLGQDGRSGEVALIEITSGLHAEDQIIKTDMGNLRPGTAVRITPASANK